MPTPKNMGAKTAAKPAAKKVEPKVEKQVITQADVGVVPASLMKSNTAPAAMTGVKIPGFLQQTTMPETSDRSQSGYVGFASSQSQKWLQQQQAGLQEGQPFLYHQNAYLPLTTLEFFLCMGTSFQTMMVGKKGDFHFVTRDMELKMQPQVVNGNATKLEPHYVCLLLVNTGNSLLPIKGDFRGTKSGGMENAIRAVEAASNPDWLRLSEQHKATAAFPQPWGRVYHTISTKRGVSKLNGNPYFSAECNCTPASVSQMQLLVAALKDEAFTNALTEAHTNYNARIEFLDNVMTNKDKQKQGGNG